MKADINGEKLNNALKKYHGTVKTGNTETNNLLKLESDYDLRCEVIY